MKKTKGQTIVMGIFKTVLFTQVIMLATALGFMIYKVVETVV